ncbi:MAG: tRNA (adenosine(37)-N6)-threonylcarbamoyltransferase complex dimerization subunit type 1 TsaB [Sphingobium sp.]|nr:tRNA (adenosine(37)-N6)-threonylcarbamoyltransferase complex dimerization subunit type 1 TsaB [Sphingobium sp.]
MRQLVIDTATEALSVALLDDGRVIASHHEIAGRGHAEKLMPIIAAMENGGRADEIIANHGPGSFTGVRVGLAAARALAYAWGVPLRAYGSLSLIASMARKQDMPAGNESLSSDIIVTMNGGHGEIFWQIFDRLTLFPKTQPTSTAIAELAGQGHKGPFYGTAALTLVEAQGYGDATHIHPDARAFTDLPVHLIHADVMPLYGRGADAIPIDQRPQKQKEK